MVIVDEEAAVEAIFFLKYKNQGGGRDKSADNPGHIGAHRSQLCAFVIVLGNLCTQG